MIAPSQIMLEALAAKEAQPWACHVEVRDVGEGVYVATVNGVRLRDEEGASLFTSSHGAELAALTLAAEYSRLMTEDPCETPQLIAKP